MISYLLCLCPAILFPAMPLWRESRDSSTPVLNNVRTLHVPKISSFSLQPGRRLFLKPVRDISEISWTQVFEGWGRHQHPTWRTRVTLFVWVITFDLSGLGDPASSYATADLVLRIIWPHEPHHYIKVGTTSGGVLRSISANLRHCSWVLLMSIANSSQKRNNNRPDWSDTT